MKKLIWVLSALVLVGVLMCGAASAASNGTDGNITWSLDDDGVLSISGEGEMPDYANISSHAPWESERSLINSVIISEGVTKIGSAAFFDCENLTDIQVADSLTYIGESAFEKCYNLSTIILPDNMSFIGQRAFMYCTSLQEFTIPHGVSIICVDTFLNCTSLTRVQIPDSVTVIGQVAFDGCSSLTSLSIPASVTTINLPTFGGCSSLSTITVHPDNANYSSVDGVLFNKDRTELIQYPIGNQRTSYAVPNGATSIGYDAFLGCSYLTDVSIPNSVTELRTCAFKNCSNLTNISIPNSIATIGFQAFCGCSSLTNIAIPNNVTKIDYEAFKDCTCLTNISIPASVSKSEIRVFSGCTSLTDVSISSNYLLSYNYGLFDGCSSLKTVTLSTNVTGVECSNFTGCTALTDIYYLGTAEQWASVNVHDSSYSQNSPFNNAAVHYMSCGVNGDNLTWSLTDSGVLSISGTGNMTDFTSYNSTPWYDNRSGITGIEIGADVTSIGDYAFSGLTNVTSLTVPQSVTRIGDFAFLNCSGLTSISLPSDVSLGLCAFYNCSGLADSDGLVIVNNILFRCRNTTTNEITVPNGVYRIDASGNDFYGQCRLVLPDTITTIQVDDSYPGSIKVRCNPGTTTESEIQRVGWPYRNPGQKYDLVYLHTNGVQAGIEIRNADKDITEFTIPDNVSSIGNSAFYGCTGLTSILLPDGVTNIGSNAFYGCTGLTSITIPSSVTNIGNNAFGRCTNMTTIHVENGNTSYLSEDGILYNKDRTILIACPGKFSGAYNIPSSVTSIGNYAFSGCTGLTNIVLPNGISSIGESAFSGCTGLTSITFPNSVTSIGINAFYNCTSLTNITIPDGVTTISSFSFEYCNFNYVSIPASVTRIQDYAFAYGSVGKVYYAGTQEEWNSIIIGSNNTKLTSATRVYGQTGPYVTSSGECGDGVMWELYDTGLLVIPGNGEMTSTPWTSSNSSIREVVIEEGVGNIAASAFQGCSYLRQITIPDTVTEIGDSAFRSCTNLTNVAIPHGVTNIGNYLFYGCTNLTEITIPDGVIRIGDYVFQNCSKLASIVIPDGITSIGDYVFQNCSSLASIVIPDSVTTFGDNTFSGSYTSTKVYCSLGSQAALYRGQHNRAFRVPGTNYNLQYLYTDDSQTGLEIQAVDKDVETLIIPDSVTSIGLEAFSNCTGLTSITIPDSVTTIGYYAFSGCSSLASITIPGSVTTIGYNAFSGCTSLTSITIPGSVTTIGYDAFYNCTGLTGITFSAGTTSISYNAFAGCTNLSSINMQNGIPTFVAATFDNCPSTLTIILPNATVNVNGALFGSCGDHAIYTCADGALNIYGTGAIWNYPQERYTVSDYWSGYSHYVTYGYRSSAPWKNSSVRSVVVHNGITSIGGSAFARLTSLTSVSIPASVLTIGATAFDNCTKLADVHFVGNGPSIASDAFASVTASIHYAPNSTWVGKIQNYGGTLTWIKPSASCGTDSVWVLDDTDTLRLRGSGIVSEATWTTYADDITTLIIAADLGGISSGVISTLPNLNQVIFEGDLPVTMAQDAFTGITATVYYSHSNPFWTDDNKLDYGGTLTWQMYCAHSAATVTLPQTTYCDEVAPADCVTNGTIAHWQCAVCGNAFTDETLSQLMCNEDLVILAPGHVLVAVEGFAATCTEPGLSDEIFCEVCGETLQTQEEIPALGHTDIVTIEALDPTCTTDGHTAQYVCETCGEILAVSETIPATGHTYGQPETEWSEDGTTCTFTFVCEHEDDTQVLEITAEATVQEAPGCETMGTTLYTATAELNEQTYSDTTTRVDIAATGHTPVDDPAVAPTDRETGLTAGSHCEACGTVLVVQETIPALWSYTEDGLTATAYNGTETALTIPAGVTTLSNTLFKNNTTITSVVIPDSVTTIGTQTFFGATALTDVWLPDTLDGIGTQTFYNTTAALHASMDSQTARALSLRNKNFTDGEWTLRYRVTSLTSAPTAVYLAGWNGDAENLVLPGSFGSAPLTQILAGAFDGQTQLRTVTIPDSVTTIAADAFSNCSEDLVICSSWNSYARTWANDNSITWAHDQHTPSVIAAVASTCTETGLTEGSVCAECGAVITAQDEVPALGHEWSEVTYTWAEDNMSVTATRTCTRDAEHIEMETAGVTGEITKPASCTESGETTYTSAAFENEAFTIQTRTLANIDAIGHSWSEVTYTWAEDNSTVTATRVCVNDAEHVETETVSVTAVVTTQPTCLTMGETTYTSVAFENEAFTVQTKTLTDVDAIGHAWDEPTYTWAEDNSTVTATRVCGNDAEHVETETVSVTCVVTTSPSQTVEGAFKYVSATFENEAFEIQEKAGGVIPALSAMTAPTFPANLTTIEDEAFENTPFQAIIIPDSVTAIGNRAFANCRNLIYVRVPAGVTVPADAFAGCPNVIIDYVAD